MGLRAMRIEMVNCGTRPYFANGYPAVRVLDGDRKPLDVAVTNGTSAISRIEGFDGPPKPVTVPPGDKVAAVVVWRNTVTEGTVAATTGTYLGIAPAAGGDWQTVRPDGGIDVGTTGKIGVSPWVRPRQG
jgi:hypothetical protein